MTDERYVVKLASGEWLSKEHYSSITLAGALKTTRAAAYRLAAKYESMGAVALRLKPSARAAELAKLRAEVESHKMAVRLLQHQLDAMTAERDALAAKLAALPPARPVEELRDELRGIWRMTSRGLYDGSDGLDDWTAVAKRARELGAR